MTALVLSPTSAPAHIIGGGQHLGRLNTRSHELKARAQTNFSRRAATIVMRSSKMPWRKREMFVDP